MRFVPGEQPATSRLRLSQLLGRGAHRLARMDGLRHRRRKRWASSAVSEALKTASGVPKFGSSFPAMRAPRPGVRASATHPKYWSESIEREARASLRSPQWMCQLRLIPIEMRPRA